MRLQDMLHILQTYPPLARIKAEPVQGMPGKQVINGADAMRAAVRELREIPILRAPAETVMANPVFRLIDGSIIEDGHVAAFAQTTSSLFLLTNQIMSLLSAAAPRHDPSALHIKLPPLASLRELGDFIKAMDHVFDMPARRLFGDGVQFSGFDIGSDWLIVTPEMLGAAAVAGKTVAAAGGVAVVLKNAEAIRDFLFSFLKAFQEWRMDNVRYQLMLAQAEHFQGAVDLAKGIRAKQAEIAEQQKELIVTQLIRAHAPGVEQAVVSEVCNAAKLAMTELDKWVKLGAEVHPALGAPEPVRNLLPEPVTAIAPTPKQLTAGPSDTTKPS